MPGRINISQRVILVIPGTQYLFLGFSPRLLGADRYAKDAFHGIQEPLAAQRPPCLSVPFQTGFLFRRDSGGKETAPIRDHLQQRGRRSQIIVILGTQYLFLRNSGDTIPISWFFAQASWGGQICQRCFPWHPGTSGRPKAALFECAFSNGLPLPPGFRRQGDRPNQGPFAAKGPQQPNHRPFRTDGLWRCSINKSRDVQPDQLSRDSAPHTVQRRSNAFDPGRKTQNAPAEDTLSSLPGN